MFSIPDAAAGGGSIDDVNLAAAALGGFGSIMWAVPSLILSVPGLLLVLAIGAQALGGLDGRCARYEVAVDERHAVQLPATVGLVACRLDGWR